MKNLRYFFIAALAMISFNAMADDVVFDFNAMDLPVSHGQIKDGDTVVEEASDAGDINEAVSFSASGYTLTINPKEPDNKTPNRFWKTNNGPQLRMYSNIIVIAGAQMKTITFDATSNFNLTPDVGTLTEKTWTGDAQSVTFTVSKNTQINKITISTEASVVPQPETKGTFENPLTVAQVLEEVQAMEADKESTVDYIFKGKISTITSEFASNYGNATFKISDNGETANEFTCYRVLYLENKKWVDGNTQIAKGDEVIVCGKVVNYRGTTPETTASKAYVYSLNGKTKEEGGDTPGPQVEKITVARALEIIAGLASKTATTETYEIEGVVAEITETFNPTYGNYTFNMKDEGGSATLLVYRAKNADNQKFTEDVLHVNDKVVVKAQLQKYGNDDVPETKNAVILTINGTPTAIEIVKANTKFEGKIYNVAGQAVNKGYKGLVIMNGRKFIQK